MLPSLHISKLNIEIELLNDFPVFDFLGAKLRGGLGNGLLAYLCDHQNLQICSACPRFTQCSYPQTFKSHGFDHIVQQGADSRKRRSPFKVLSARDLFNQGKPIYTGRDIAHPVSYKIDDLIAQTPFPSGHTKLAIHFISPTRIDRKQSQYRDYKTGLTVFKDFFDLLIDAVDRVAELWQIYDHSTWIGQGEYWRWRSRLLDAGKKQIHSGDNNLIMVNLKRYSSLQKHDMDMSGFIGQMKFEGDFSDFKEVLLAAELLHIGKETALGLGRYVIRY
jgi:hypothetical protein